MVILRIRTGIEARFLWNLSNTGTCSYTRKVCIFCAKYWSLTSFFTKGTGSDHIKKHWFRSDQLCWINGNTCAKLRLLLIDLPQITEPFHLGLSHTRTADWRNNWERWEREKYWDRRLEDRGNGEREEKGQNRECPSWEGEGSSGR